MGLWHRMKVRLGLEDDWDDEYYDDEDDDYDDDDLDDGPATTARHESVPVQLALRLGRRIRARSKRLDRGPDLDRARDGGSSSLRSVPTGGASVTPVSANMKMHIVEPKSFTEAQSDRRQVQAGHAGHHEPGHRRRPTSRSGCSTSPPA